MPDPVTVPPEAVTAAAERTFTEMRKHPSFGLAPEEWARGVAFDLAMIVLEAGGPLIAAAERERIADWLRLAGYDMAADHIEDPMLGEDSGDE